MKKRTLHTNPHIAAALTLCMALKALGCGGGMVPYVPTQTGASGGSSTQPTGQFYLLEKGVTYDLFDVKKLQPLFRNIILSGNERKTRVYGARRRLRTKTADRDTLSTAATKDSVATKADAAKPVLNIHRLH